MKRADNPGVHIPPPLIYAAIFAGAFLIQKVAPINDHSLKSLPAQIAGILFFAAALFFTIRSLTQFFRTKNTVVTIKPAASLQTNGIYHITRNPMYIGLLFIYLGFTCFIGNWWNFIFLPILLTIVQEYIIKREEKYLDRRFGQEYLDYKASVGRWI